MKTKVIILLSAGAVALCTLIAFETASKNQQQRKLEPTSGRLKWHAAEAKREGNTKVVISTNLNSYLGSENSSIEQAFVDYSVVVAEPVAKQTYEYDDNNLRTWYKFRIIDALNGLKNPACADCVTLAPPAELLPLDSNEFVLPHEGGNLSIDGIEIEQREPGFSQFQKNQKYLLFLSLYPNGVALTSGGPIGVFVVDQHDGLTSLHAARDTLKDGIEQKFGSSLNRVKAYLKR